MDHQVRTVFQQIQRLYNNRSGTFEIWAMGSDGTEPTQPTFDAREKTQVPDVVAGRYQYRLHPVQRHA